MASTKKTIAIDFDDTLIATTPLLKPRIFSALAEIGITHERSQNSYRRVRDELFSIEKYAAALGRSPSETHLIRGALRNILAEPHAYNYPVDGFLRSLKKCHRLILLTYGDRRHQLSKIEQSGFGKYFQEIIFSPAIEKEVVLRRLKKRYPSSLVVVDDSSEAIFAAHLLGIPAISVSKDKKSAAYYKQLQRRIERVIN